MAGALSPRDFSEPPLWSWRLAFFLGLLPLVAALGFLITPTTATAMWGLPTPATPSHRAYLGLLGARDLYLAASVLLFWLRGEKRVVGWLLLLGGGVPAADGLVAVWNGAAVWQIAQHWGASASAVCAVVGYSLIA